MRTSLRAWLRHRAAFIHLPRPSGTLGLRVHAYVGAVVVVAAGLSTALLLLADRGLERPWLLAVIAALVALEKGLSITIRRRGQGESLANEEALIVFAALLLAPASAFVAVAVGMVASQATLRLGPLKAVFNAAQATGSAALAFLVVDAVAPAGESGHWRAVVAALLGALVFSLVNRAAVAGVIALTGSSSFRDDFRSDLGPAALLWSGTVSVGLLAGLAGLADVRALPFALVAMVVLSVAFSGHARARRERQASSELIRSAAAAIFSVDRSGRVRAWNPELERITGVTAAEAAGSKLSQLVHAYRADGTVADLLSPLALSDPDDRKTIKIQAAAGAERWLTLSRATLPDGGFAFVAQDVTEQREAEEAVRESEERLRLALEAGQMGWWEWDFASDGIQWSESLEVLNGLEPGSFGGTFADFLATIHPDDRDGVARTTDSALAEGGSEIVYRIVRPDGSVRWIEDMGNVLHAADGRPVKMVGVERDITERKRAEALSALQRQVLEEIAAGTPLATILERLVQLFEEQSEGTLASVLLLDEDGRHLRHGAAPSLPGAYNQAIDGVEIGPEVGSCGTAAYRRERVVVSDIAADPLWAEFRELALGHGLRACWSVPILGSGDNVVGTFGMYYAEPRQPSAADLELTELGARLAGIAIERARQEQRLVGAEAKYRRLVEQLPVAVYAFTPADRGPELRGLTQYLSPQGEALLGYSADEWRDDPELYSTIVHPEDRERVRHEVQRARALGDRFSAEYRMVAKDGRVVWVHDESVYVRDEEGRVVRVEGFLLDVSGRKELESSLLQAQKMDAVGQLAGGIAHDFNNLISAVIGFGELVLGRLEEGDPAHAQVQQIVRAGERAASMTNQLLAFSRKQMLQPRVLDLNAVVADSEQLLGRLIGEDIALTCVLDPEVEPVLADPVQLEQAIVNLAVNARDAMPTGGRLTIETANVEIDSEYAASHVDVQPGHYVVLAVSDTGEGMDAETQARIFEPFFTTKREGRGTGLGLATVFGIVKQSGGNVSVYSEPAHGTTFKLYLPRAEHSLAQDEHEPASATLLGGSETILLVEDEDLVRDLERQLLEECGYTVLEARDAQRALDLAASHGGPIDLLLTDVVMPGLGGRELVERLTPDRPRMKVLYSSGYADDAVVRHGVLEAEVEFLAKPFTPSALAAKVREVLDATEEAA